MANLTTVSHQWRTRPDDERFTSLTELLTHSENVKARSQGKTVASRSLVAEPVKGDHDGLVLVGPSGGKCDVTHYSFGQLCNLGGCPATFLREQPSELAADNLNWGLQINRAVQDVGVLLTQPANGGHWSLRAATGPNYGRVWNADIVRSLVKMFGDGVTGYWRVPGEFGKAVQVTKENTTIYASDRDLFVFLADEERRITIPNRRDGKSGSMARGFYVWNSEVGSKKLGLAMFLFDYCCCNRIIWGATEFKEISVRHTSSAPDRWVEEVRPLIKVYAEASAKPVEVQLLAAQKTKVSRLDEFLSKRHFTSAQQTGIKAAFKADENRELKDGATLWDIATGATAYARQLTYQDSRVAVEKEAGNIFGLAA
jgi:hypothetical protein